MDFFGNVFSDIEEESEYENDIFSSMLEELMDSDTENTESMQARVPTKRGARARPSFNASQADILGSIDKSGYNVQQTYQPHASQSFISRRAEANQAVSPQQLEAYWLNRLKGFVNG